MLVEFQDWMIDKGYDEYIDRSNYREFFQKFLKEGYNPGSYSNVISDILTEIYELSIAIKSLYTNKYGPDLINRLMEEILNGQEDEKSNKRNSKSRVNTKKSGEKKRKVSELRPKSTRSRN